jgi:hypothetical protein
LADRVFVPTGGYPDAETKAKIESGEFACVGIKKRWEPDGVKLIGVWYGPKKRDDGLIDVFLEG